MRKRRQETQPYVAWGIFREMVRSFDDSQLETVQRIIDHERERRQLDRGQLWLINEPALRE